jgi:hypothetical protein
MGPVANAPPERAGAGLGLQIRAGSGPRRPYLRSRNSTWRRCRSSFRKLYGITGSSGTRASIWHRGGLVQRRASGWASLAALATILTRLDGRAGDRAIGAKHTAPAVRGPHLVATRPAMVGALAGVRGHGLNGSVLAPWAPHHALQLHLPPPAKTTVTGKNTSCSHFGCKRAVICSTS